MASSSSSIFSLEVATPLNDGGYSGGGGGGAGQRYGNLMDEDNYDAYNNFSAAALVSNQAAAAAGDVLAYAGGGGGRAAAAALRGGLGGGGTAGTSACLCWRRIGIADDDLTASIGDEEQLELPDRDAPGRIFLDASGRHVLCIGANNGDVYHIDTKQTGTRIKARPLPKLKSVGITAVGWAAGATAAAPPDQYATTSMASGAGGDNGSSRSADALVVVLGTCTGHLYEMSLDAREKNPVPKALTCQTADAGEPITSLHQRRAAPNSVMIIAATPTRLYIFTHITGQTQNIADTDSSKSLLAAAAENLAQCVELPGRLGRSELRFYNPREPNSMGGASYGGASGSGNGGNLGIGSGETIAWLAGPGIYFATLKLILPPNSSNHLAERQLLQYSDLGLGAVGVGSNDDDADNEAFAPLSMALTEFHFLLLYPMKVLAVNRQSGTVVQEMRLSGIVESHSPILTDERMQACYLLVRHPARLLVVDAFDEARDMWRVHLEKKQFDRALEFANEEQQAIVLDAQAESCFRSHDYERAAIIWGGLVNASHTSKATFEEKALRFVEGNCPDALTTYLLTTLDHLHPKRDMSQRTMLGTWITELYLDKLNRAQTAVGAAGFLGYAGGSSSSSSGIKVSDSDGNSDQADEDFQHDAVLEDFKSFLKRYADVLDAKTTKQLLGGGGRISELAFYCEIIGEWERVIDYHLGRRDAQKVLAILRRVGVGDTSRRDERGGVVGHAAAAELHYRYAGALMEIDPTGAVDAWIAMGTRLEPRMLAPMLMLYGADPSGAHLRSRPGEPPSPSTDVAQTPASTTGTDYTEARREAIRFLEHCVYRLKVVDVAVHNLLLSLYVQESTIRVPEDAARDRKPSAEGEREGVGSVLQADRSPHDDDDDDDDVDDMANGEDSGGLDSGMGGFDDPILGVGADEPEIYADEGEAALLNYLNKFAGLSASETVYDVRYALRLCLINEKSRSVVFILCLLGMYEEAIEVALDSGSAARMGGGGGRARTRGENGGVADTSGTRDLRLARIVADKPEDDAMRKKLWLRLARDVINENAAATAAAAAAAASATTTSSSSSPASTKSENIRRAIAFIRETDGLLKIEDILPFFPDFILIDDFKEAICEALEDYNTDIKELTRDMDEATRGAELIRRDILNLADRHLQLDAQTTRCASCLCPVLSPPPQSVMRVFGAGLGIAVGGEAFFGFPCGMVFHSECLAKEVALLSTDRQKKRMHQLQYEAQRIFNSEGNSGVGLAASNVGTAVTGPAAGVGDADVQLTDFFGLNTAANTGVSVRKAGGDLATPGSSINSTAAANLLASGEGLAALSSSSLLGDSGAGALSSARSSSSVAANASSGARDYDFACPPCSNGSLQSTLDELHDMLCSECPFCSDMIIRTITMPLSDSGLGLDLDTLESATDGEVLTLDTAM